MKWHDNYPKQPSLIHDLYLVSVDYSALADVIKTIGIIELTRVKRILIKDALEDGMTLCEEDFHIERRQEYLFDIYSLVYSFGADNHIHLEFHIDKVNIRRQGNNSHYGLFVHLSEPRLAEAIRSNDYLVKNNWIAKAEGTDISFALCRLDHAINLFLYTLSSLPSL